MLGAGYWMLGAGYWMLDSGYQMINEKGISLRLWLQASLHSYALTRRRGRQKGLSCEAAGEAGRVTNHKITIFGGKNVF